MTNWKSRERGSNTAWYFQCVPAAIIPATTGRYRLLLNFDLQTSKPDHDLERPVQSGNIDVLLAGVEGEVRAAVDRHSGNRLVLGMTKAKVVDTTIANVALRYIAGGLSAAHIATASYWSTT